MEEFGRFNGILMLTKEVFGEFIDTYQIKNH